MTDSTMRVIVCHPDDADAVREALDSLERQGWHRPVVRVNAFTTAGQVLVLDTETDNLLPPDPCEADDGS